MCKKLILSFIFLLTTSCTAVFENLSKGSLSPPPKINNLNCQYQYYYLNKSFECSPSVDDPSLESLQWSLSTQNTCTWASVHPSTGKVTGLADSSNTCTLSVQVQNNNSYDKFELNLHRIKLTSMGSPLSTAINEWMAIALDPTDEKPFMVFRDENDGGNIKVYKWSSDTSWVNYGTVGTDGNWATIAIDPTDNKPVVVWQTHSNYRINVAKWDTGTTWTDLGEAGSTGTANNPTIDLASDGTIYAFYRDHWNKQLVVYSKSPGMDGTLGTGDDGAWVSLGVVTSTTEDNAYYRHPVIKVDPADNRPIVAFTDTPNGGRIKIMKWDSGTSWMNYGYMTSARAVNFSMILDPVDNKPVVAYEDLDDNRRVAVSKWSGFASWEDWGYITTQSAEFPSLAIDPRDNSYLVLLSDTGDSGRDRLFRRNNEGEWIDEGMLSEGEARAHPVQRIQVDSNGRVYSGFRDYENGDLPTAVYLEP